MVDARRRAGAEGNPWRVLLDRLYKQIPRDSIHNGSLHLLTGHYDAGYVGSLFLPTRGPHDTHHQLSFLISFLVPCYVVSSLVLAVAPTTRSSGVARYTQFTFTPDEEPYAQIITEEILAVFGGPEDEGRSQEDRWFDGSFRQLRIIAVVQHQRFGMQHMIADVGLRWKRFHHGLSRCLEETSSPVPTIGGIESPVL